MKAQNKIATITMLAIVLFAAFINSGCKKWLDINNNPNAHFESNTTPDQVLQGALLKTSQIMNLEMQIYNHWLGYWCPASDGFSRSGETSYQITTNYTVSNIIFQDILFNSSNYQFIQDKARETGQRFYESIARIMKAHNFAVLIDQYNNIAYSEALQGVNGYSDINLLFPRYEDAKTIYENLIKQLDTAITEIKGAVLDKNINISTADVMFKGSKSKWIKFCNTLKLRLLIHQANRSDRSAYIQTEIAKIEAEGTGFLGSGENAGINPGFVQTNATQVNPYYNDYGFTVSGGDPSPSYYSKARANVIAMNYLKTDQDPRLAFFYKPVQTNVPGGGAEPFSQLPPNNYRGNQYGLPINTSQYPYQSSNYVSKVGGISSAGAVSTSSSGIIKGYNMDMWILTSVESMFLQAEAILRGWKSGDTKVAYKNAIQESFRWLNVGGNSSNTSLSDNSFNSWYNSQTTNVNVNWDIAADKNKLLAYQKYMALNGIAPLEAWTDYRRNGSFPNIPLSADPARLSNVLPVRLLYSQIEYTNNSVNVEAQGTINQFTSKIWWMP